MCGFVESPKSSVEIDVGGTVNWGLIQRIPLEMSSCARSMPVIVSVYFKSLKRFGASLLPREVARSRGGEDALVHRNCFNC